MFMRIRTRSSLILFTLCLLAIAAAPLLAQFGTGTDVIGPMRTLQGDNDRRGDTRAPNRTVERRQQAQDVMQESARQLDEALVDILQTVNRGERLAPEKIEACKAAYEDARKYAPQFNDSLKCETFLLWSWTEYFGKDIEQAFRQAKNACDADRDNQDANATQAAMSILLGRAPLKIEPRRVRTTPGRGGTDPYAQRQNERAAQINVQASSGNILQLDVEAIDASLLGKPVGPMRLTCVNGTTLDYNPAQSNLCMLFWQLGVKDTGTPGEPNNAPAQPGRPVRSPSPRPTPQNMNDSRNPNSAYRGRPDPRRGSAYDEPAPTDPRRGYDDPSRRNAYSYDRDRGAPSYDYGDPMAVRQPGPLDDPLVVETAAYGRLFGAYLGNPRVSFVAVNTDPITNAPAVVQKLLENPWPWANVMAAAPTSGAPQYADLNPQRPMVAIVSAGKIQYAGPADGFLAPMVLEHLAGEPVSAGIMAPPANAAQPSNSLLNPLMNLLGGTPGARPQPPTPNPPQPVAPQPRLTPSGGDEEELTPESYEAEKKLTYARQLFIPAGRKMFLTSKRGVDLCREIIRDYPNTQYAQEARLLLRQVPENERKRYNITDEEMGL